MHDEIEIKLDLQNRYNYDLLRKRLGPPIDVVKQTNHFFDTEGRDLLKKGWALRLRQENGRCLITLKGPRRTASRCPSIRAEYETAFDCGQLIQAINGGIEPAECPDPIGLQLKSLEIGEILTKILDFQNNRTTMNFAESGLHLSLELDITQFSDNSLNYELEAELNRPDDYPTAFGAIELLLNELGIPVRIMHKSKFARALKRMNLDHLYRET